MKYNVGDCVCFYDEMTEHFHDGHVVQVCPDINGYQVQLDGDRFVGVVYVNERDIFRGLSNAKNQQIKCECGSEAIGAQKHSSWCPVGGV